MKQRIDMQLFSNSIREGDLEKVRDLVLNQGYDINMIDDSTQQPMFTRAILSQHIDIIDFFFEQGAEINPTWNEGEIFMTPLAACVRFVMEENSMMATVFDKLLTLGANPNPLNSSCVPLTEAIDNHSNFSNTRSIYEKLVTTYNADVNNGGIFEKPIILAIKKGDLELVKFLVDKGANIEIDGDCNTTLIAAIKNGKPDVVEYLVNISKGLFDSEALFKASINYYNTKTAKIFSSNLSEESIKNIYTDKFIEAIYKGDLKAANHLVSTQAADINMLDNDLTPMFSHAIHSQNQSIIDFFFDQNADVNPVHEKVAVTPFETSVRTVLSSNSESYACEVLQKLFDLGANPNPSNSILTPLATAIKSDLPDAKLVIETLIDDYKADVNNGRDIGKPIILAIEKGNLELVKYLVSKGADIEIDGNCNYVLSAAILYQKADVVSYLIEKAVTDNKTFSPKIIIELARKSQNQEISNLFTSKMDVDASEFAQAISQGNLSKVEYLVLMQGADINMLDNNLVPMFSHAILSKNQGIINFFFDQNADVNPVHEKVSMTPLGAAAVTLANGLSFDDVSYNFSKLLKSGAKVNPTNSTDSPLLLAIQHGSKFAASQLIGNDANLNIGDSYQEQLVELIRSDVALSSKFMMKGILKIKGSETNIFKLTLSDIIEHLKDIDNIEFTKPIETNRQYLDIVMQVYLDSRYNDNKEQLDKFYELITSLFQDKNKVTKLVELGATNLDAAFIRDDVNAISQISGCNSETDIYKLAQIYRMAELSRDIYPNSNAMSSQIALNGTFVPISSLPYNAFVTRSDWQANNLFINITCGGGATWDYNKAGYFSKCIESSFATTIHLGSGTQYITPSYISTIFNHDKMNSLLEQNLDFALVIVNSHDSKESKSFSSVLSSLTTKLAKSTVVLIDSCYSGQYHDEFVIENGVFLISASTDDQTSCGADRVSEFSKYFSAQPDLFGILKYCIENYTQSTPCFSGKIGGKTFKSVPIKELLEELGDLQSPDNSATDEIIQIVEKENVATKLELWSTLSTHSTESESWGYAPPHYLGYDDIVPMGDDEYDNYDGSFVGGAICGCTLF